MLSHIVGILEFFQESRLDSLQVLVEIIKRGDARVIVVLGATMVAMTIVTATFGTSSKKSPLKINEP